jgi:HAD superfamily hydrolase (TIGR01509 family)
MVRAIERIRERAMELRLVHATNSPPCPIRGLLFDMGDVLCDDTLWRRWLLQLLGHLGLHTHYRAFYHIWDHEYYDAVCRGQRDFGEAFEAFLLAVGLTRGQIDEVEAACHARRRQLGITARPLPGVRPTLAQLRLANVTLGILTNSEHPSEAIRRHFESFGIADVFSTILSSLDLGYTMPSHECYCAALQQMHLPANQVAFVGHDSAELTGAGKAGMTTIAFNYAPDAVADVFISRFDELIGLADGRATQAAA